MCRTRSRSACRSTARRERATCREFPRTTRSFERVMGRRNSGPAHAALRERLAQAAARLMIEGGIEDYGLAKRKAAEKLGVKDLGALPSNAQIDSRVAERQRNLEPTTLRRRG